MTEVKVCGLCRPEDAAVAAAAGVRYAGVVLAPGRLRTQSAAEAARILDAAGGIRRVGVFVDPSLEDVVRAARTLRLDIVQLHGRESPGLAAAVAAAGPWRVWKAVHVGDGAAAAAGIEQYGSVVDGVLLDGGGGGEGVAFDWSAAGPARRLLPPGRVLVVAGGLGPANVARAVRALDPDVVDVSSGVETSPGMKSAAAIHAFVAAAHAARRAFPSEESP